MLVVDGSTAGLLLLLVPEEMVNGSTAGLLLLLVPEEMVSDSELSASGMSDNSGELRDALEIDEYNAESLSGRYLLEVVTKPGGVCRRDG